MKKLLIAVVIILLLLLAGIYVYIPGSFTVSATATLHGTVTGSSRALLQKDNWKKCWAGTAILTPGASFTRNDLLLYKNDTFRITKLLQNAVGITISNHKQVNSMLMIVPWKKDVIALNWTYKDTMSSNPFIRIQQYQSALKIKKNMDAALQHIAKFLSLNENVYGISIKQTSTYDTTLVSTYSILNQYPATGDIYMLVKKLQAYIATNKAQQTGNPMLNITQLDKNQYRIMVALPVNKLLEEQGTITYKRLIRGNYLTTTITGGDGIINNAYQQMQYYFADYKRVAMAIPFQVLVTDRSKETDTAKWVTKLYFPVM